MRKTAAAGERKREGVPQRIMAYGLQRVWMEKNKKKQKNKHADFRNSLLKKRDLMRFQISMKATGDIFSKLALFESPDGYL